MLIEFRGSELRNHQRINSISSRRKQIFCFQLGVLPTASLPGAMCLLIHQGGGGQLVPQTPGSRIYPLPAVGQEGPTWLKMHGNRHGCKSCAKYSCTCAACLVVGMQSWRVSLSRGGFEVDAAFRLCCKRSPKNNVFLKKNIPVVIHAQKKRNRYIFKRNEIKISSTYTTVSMLTWPQRQC